MKIRFTAVLLIITTSLFSQVRRILPSEVRAEYIDKARSLLNYENEELKANIPYVVNPYFFEQPLLLKINSPGGLDDRDLLQAVGTMLVGELSGAFIRGQRRSLLMNNGELLREGDEITREIPEFNNMQTTVTIALIRSDGFTLELNNTEYDVILGEQGQGGINLTD